MDKARKVPLAIVAGVTLLVGLGAAGAIAATKVLSPGDQSKAVIDDAASQLGVTPTALTNALKQALKNRIDAAVAAGTLTKEQAAELKARIDSNDFPLLGPGPFGGHGPFGHDFGHPGRSQGFAAAAAYLGLSEADLRTQLVSGKTLADVAKAQGKSVSGLVDAMVAAIGKSIDEAVAAGKLTKQQADTIKGDLQERVTGLVNGEHAPFGDGDGHRSMPWRVKPRGPSASLVGPNV